MKNAIFGKGRKFAASRKLRSGLESSQYVCFYCRKPLLRGSGRKFTNFENGPVREVHSRHAVLSTEIPFKEEQE